VKDVCGNVLSEGKIPATRQGLQEWVGTLAKPWTVAMEATMFTGWIYDYLRPHAAAVKVAHSLMLRAIAVAKKKNDRIDASKIADCLRCDDLLPECYMAPMEIRQRRRTLRYRKLLVPQNVQLKNKIAQMLMESGVSYNKKKLHQQGISTRSAHHPGDRSLAMSSAEAKPRDDRAYPENGTGSAALARSRPPARGAGRSVDDHSCGGPRHGADLGPDRGASSNFWRS
jgi:transposase